MQTRSRLTAASVLLHLVVLGMLVYRRALHVEAIRLPGNALGSRISLTYSPGRAASQASVKVLNPVPSRLALPSTLVARTMQSVASTNTTAAASANPNSPQGGDALGAGNVTVALATFFPTPHPDLGSLPHGTRGDVIVDVVIDEQGRIVTTQVAQGLGHGIDEIVLATIQTWTFKPATKDGIAVPSQQELLFHYEHS